MIWSSVRKPVVTALALGLMAMTAQAAVPVMLTEHPATTAITPKPLNPVLSVDRQPRVLEIVEIGALTGTPIPKAVGFIEENDLVDVVIFLTNGGGTAATNTSATLIPPAGAGITVLTGPVRYGRIAPGASVPRVFQVLTQNAAVALHAYQLSVTHDAGTANLSLEIPVWGLDLNIIDITSGQVDAVVRTPFSTDSVSFVAPEVFDAQGLPSYFDLKSLTQTRSHNAPFNGPHWADAVGDVTLGLTGPALASRGVAAAEPAPGDASTFDLHGVVKTKSGAPVPGAKITVNGPDGAMTATTNAEGQYWFEGKTPGTYTNHVEPPELMKKFWATTWGKPHTFGGGTPVGHTWTYPDPPSGSGGGGSGSGGGNTKKSLISGGAVTGGTLIINLLAAPETFGAALLSGLGSGLIGGGTAVGADPIDSDIFYAGQTQTVPTSTTETTLAEDVTIGLSIVSPPVGTQNFIVQSNFDYHRTTDAATYNWTGTETLDVPIYLSLQGTTAKVDGSGSGVVVTTTVVRADGTVLTGGDPTVLAYLGDLDSFNGPVGYGVLHDDGQAPDATANDGLFSALITTGGPVPLPLTAFVWAARTGWEEADNPPLNGSAQVDVSP